MLQYEKNDVLEGMTLITQVYQQSVSFVIIGTLKMLVTNLYHIF